MTDEWITHDGGPCPVSPASRPGVVFRGRPDRLRPPGCVEADFWRGLAGELDWWHWRLRGEDNHDIIAYKPELRP